MSKSKPTTENNRITPAADASLSNHITGHKPTMSRCLLSVAVASSLLLIGCNDDNETTVSYATTVEPVSAFTAEQIDTQFGLGTTATPDAKCDIKIEKVNYPTVGAAGESTNATAALMLPSGEGAECQGDRPILLYAHGTTTDKNYDFSQVANPQNSATGEATLIAANFAAQGYIVVAPNYAGYDDSDLDYHPYLVAEQQAKDMADALDSARTIIAQEEGGDDAEYAAIDDSGELFISGYSQGGHVAMATARLLEQNNETVTAISPSSGPYALAAFGDAIFAGNVNVGATRFAPLLATGLQKAYGDVYNNTADIFTASYANTQLPSLLSFSELVSANKLPDNALFEASPTNNAVLEQLPDSELPFAFLGFAADNYLIKTDFRAAYVTDALQNPDSLVAETGVLPAATPQNTLRKALKANDLRGYAPEMPTLLCGGHQDPTVFFDLNTGSMSAILQQASAATDASLNITVLDVDNTGNRGAVTSIGDAMSNPWMSTTVLDDVKAEFAMTLSEVQNLAIANAQAAGVTDPAILQQAAAAAVLGNYHGGSVSTACTQATREFFDQAFAQS